MSQFIKQTIRCEACGRPTKTIFVCSSCWTKIPAKDRQQFRAMYIKKQDTTSKRAGIVAKLKAAAAAVVAVLGGCATPPKPSDTLPKPAVQWLGNPVMAQEYATGHLTHVQFGIRDDGVVIWRDTRTIKPATVNGKKFGEFPMPPAPFVARTLPLSR